MSDAAGWLEKVRRAHTAKGRQQQGLYALEGSRMLKRALAGAADLEAVLLSDGDAKDSGVTRAMREELEDRQVPIVLLQERLLLQLSEGRAAGRCVGLVRLPEVVDAHRVLSQEHGADGSTPRNVAVAVDLEEPGNVGALARTSLASAATALVTVGRSDLYHPKAVRTSLGAVFRLPRVHFADLGECVEQLERFGMQMHAAVSQHGQSLFDVDLSSGQHAFFFGSEAHGLSPQWIERIGHPLSIPMPGSVDSFSVNAAAAVVLFEAVRQQRRQ